MYDTFHANIEEKSITQAVKACADQLVHVHISENDRSTPGDGGVNWDESFLALKNANYCDGWLTIEAFGLALLELAAATRIWCRMFPSEEALGEKRTAVHEVFLGRPLVGDRRGIGFRLRRFTT